jgi:hypothetical protein
VWLTDYPRPQEHRWGLPTVITLTPELIAAVGGATLPAELERKLARDGQVTVPTVDKTAIRVEVATLDAQHWPEWARTHGVRNMRYRALAASGGDPERWWVVERPLPRAEWVEIVEMDGGAVIWRRPLSETTATVTTEAQ